MHPTSCITSVCGPLTRWVTCTHTPVYTPLSTHPSHSSHTPLTFLPHTPVNTHRPIHTHAHPVHTHPCPHTAVHTHRLRIPLTLLLHTPRAPSTHTVHTHRPHIPLTLPPHTPADTSLSTHPFHTRTPYPVHTPCVPAISIPSPPPPSHPSLCTVHFRPCRGKGFRFLRCFSFTNPATPVYLGTRTPHHPSPPTILATCPKMRAHIGTQPPSPSPHCRLATQARPPRCFRGSSPPRRPW